MQVGVIGSGEQAEMRRRAVRAVADVAMVETPSAWAEVPMLDPALLPDLQVFLSSLDAVFVATPTAEHFYLTELAAKLGVHVFLEWPPATSLHEAEAMVKLSEEAGVEVGVSRPLRFHALFDRDTPDLRASLILLRQEIPADTQASWPHWLSDAIDLCCALAQSSSVQRVDAEAVRTAFWPVAVGCGLRFHSGSYAQISIRHGGSMPGFSLFAADTRSQLEADLQNPFATTENDTLAGAYDARACPVGKETAAFLEAIAHQRPVPVSILDGLHTMRLVERLMEKLR